ncbi:MAG: hypothetical protein CVT99_05575 [Bacteroidetes bacterium HGW-Bacteroidetes-16]|jgi:hypothetical protein|nr:MAG: hypothetical protein CVT99_05575 [Bacteroidetes bacterium HGW-Bacteroidetes-16]
MDHRVFGGVKLSNYFNGLIFSAIILAIDLFLGATTVGRPPYKGRERGAYIWSIKKASKSLI